MTKTIPAAERRAIRLRRKAAERGFDTAIAGLESALAELAEAPAEADARRVADQASRTQKALQTLLDYDLKTHGAAGPAPGALDLEAARAEIEDRLARLASARVGA
ncbi:MAG: hypothetical protein AAFS07_00770 [Pseudomonadota bacterium]